MSEAEFKPTELSNLLGGEPSEAPVAAETPSAPAEAPAVEAPAEAPPQAVDRERVPKGAPGAGQFASKDKETGGDAAATAAPADAAPAPEETPGGPPPSEAPVPQAALMGERRRRQEAENRARFLEQQLQSLTRLPQAPPTEAPKADFWDDPEAAIAARFAEFGPSLLDQFEQRQLYRSIDKSEASARARYNDFDEAIVEYERAVAANPSLAREMANAVDPAEFAYRKGKSLAEIHTYGGDVDALLAAKRAEWEAELRASAPSPTPTLPPSTATERSMGVPRAGPAWSGPKPLTELLR